MLFLLESSQWTEVTGDPLCLLSKIMVQHSTLNLMQYQPGWIRCIRCGWCNSGAVLTQGDAMQCMQWWCHYPGLSHHTSLSQGTHAGITSVLIPTELKWAREAGTAWYRSKETIPIIHPFVGGGYLSNKKWPLNEGNALIYENIYIVFAQNYQL